MKKSLFPAVFVFIAACASSRIPDDVVIRDERINWCGANWKSSYTSAGANRVVDDTCLRPGTYKQHFRTTPAQWAAVQEAIVESRFAQLPPNIEQEPINGLITVVTDDPESCIEISHHRVCGKSYDLEHTPNGARFLKVWSALTAIAPEPKH